MSYETIDVIDDAYIPLLLLLFLVKLSRNTYVLWPDYRASVFPFLYLISLLLFSYGLMFLDNAVRIWPALGLDYSTHTAVAFSLVLALCVLMPAQRMWFAISLFAYALLMMYQKYHSLLDIVTTALVLTVFALVIKKRFL